MRPVRSISLGEWPIAYTSCPEALRARGAEVRRAPATVRPEYGARGHVGRLLWVQRWLGALRAALGPAA